MAACTIGTEASLSPVPSASQACGRAGNEGTSKLAWGADASVCAEERLYAALPAAFAQTFQPISGAPLASYRRSKRSSRPIIWE